MTMTSSTKNKNQFDYEFGGPMGAFLVILLLPIVCLFLAHWSKVGHVDTSVLMDFASGSFWSNIVTSPVTCPSCDSPERLYHVAVGLACYTLFLIALERFLPGEVVPGAPIRGTKDKRLIYRLTGHLSFWVTLLVAQVGWPRFHESSGTWQLGTAPLGILYDSFAEMALVVSVLSLVFSLYLYLSSFIGNRILAHGGNSGNPVYDYFMGRELNPRWGSFDLKVFCELRPGLIGWMLLNIGCIIQQQQRLGYVTGSMIFINLFQGWYVWDALFQERAILTTMDVTTDGFGWMLFFGDLVWVPFTYSLQARYLVDNDPHLSIHALAAIVMLHMMGYAIFRGANGQKDVFRRNPNHSSVSHLKYLQTKRGTRLLISGWWGMARKINYTGDYIMGLSWCMVCGFDSIVPYYYAIYFCILLVHRSLRDDAMCKEKYGEDWETYKKLVPYRFLPGIV